MKPLNQLVKSAFMCTTAVPVPIGINETPPSTAVRVHVMTESTRNE
jgi:hypothetical protein